MVLIRCPLVREIPAAFRAVDSWNSGVPIGQPRMMMPCGAGSGMY